MKNIIPLCLIACLALTSCSQRGSSKKVDLRYDIRFPNAAHNEAEVTLTMQNLKAIPLKMSMSRTSPGRYALHEFAKNVYDVMATDGEGDTLDILRPDLHNWIVSGHDGTVKFSYTLYADRADGTYSGVNRKHAHLNMPATLVWPQGFENEEVTVRFHPPKGSEWRVATQLKPTDDPFSFTAPGLRYLMDSPTELSDLSMSSWKVRSDTADYTIRLALHHNGTDEEMKQYVEMAKKVVDEQIAVYGEPPAFDYGTYTFIADYLPYVYGDGMEHRNSTILTSRRPLEGNALRNLYTLSHEFFHGWNVERIRPASLEPFDFQEANMSKALWFAEGFTSYYDDLIIRRAGLIDNSQYGQGWGGTLNYVLHAPGSRYYSPAEMSMQAPFVDAATSVDAQNKSNTFISYYSWGAVLGLGLDLTLRSDFEGVSLDDYMRAVWEKYGIPEKPYELEGLEETLAEVTDSTEFAEQFFKRHIYGSEMPDLERLLGNAGFLLRREQPHRAVIGYRGAKIDFGRDRPTVTENTIIGSPLYRAGVDREDVILSLDGRPLNNARELNRILAAHEPGDTLLIKYESLGTVLEKKLVLAEDPTLEMVPYEEAGRELTAAMKRFRKSWLGAKSK